MPLRRILTLTVAALAVATAPPAGGQPTLCPGDCAVDGDVQVHEIVTMVNVIDGVRPLSDCPAGDADADGRVRSNDVTRAVLSLLHGCSPAAVGQAWFYRTLNGLEDRNQEVIDALTLAVSQNPADGWSWFLLGMDHLLRAGRALTDYRQPSPFVVEESRQARAALDQAVPLLPYDSRIPGFRGAATYNIGFFTGDAALIGLGLSQLDDAIQANFLFNSFSFLGAVAPSVPPTDPLFARAIEYLDAGINSGCTPFSDPRNCGNAGRAPHNIQGSFLLFGDLYVKAGRLDDARKWYGLIALFPDTATWPFTAVLDDRLATLDQRAALYRDDDPDNDPMLVGTGATACTTCHYH
jgi:hypothetical protein